MEKIQVKFGDWIEKAFGLYLENFRILVLASVFALVIGTVTIGLLTGPMLAGLALVSLELLDGKRPKPNAGVVFKGFDYFLDAFLFVLVWGIAVFIGSLIVGTIPVLGQLASLFFLCAAQAFLMFGIFLIVDRRMGFRAASVKSFHTVKANFWPFFGLSAIAGIIGSFGAVAFGIGIVFTIPIQVCILTVAYRGVFGGLNPADDIQ